MTSKRNFIAKALSRSPTGGSSFRHLAITAHNLLTQPFEGTNVIPYVIDYAATCVAGEWYHAWHLPSSCGLSQSY
ncbi:hypothetical protein K503DRAFT_480607 [Rhizopogon vinicolor AM-OR11-026]|uniref:Uncharacterized protein n=1 Tax=Rhizopogon vinicolor AM-OR11-026 TaxID=1314800 RepID=A0A1B7MMZ6_9AGAM|nr:hypothetical protein K503DRAFT_480607 [Rhizopogon vinicolor AM-OR11-026]